MEMESSSSWECYLIGLLFVWSDVQLKKMVTWMGRMNGPIDDGRKDSVELLLRWSILQKCGGQADVVIGNWSWYS